MYRDRPPVNNDGAQDLEQGDVLAGVMFPALPGDRSFGFQRTGEKGKPALWVWKKEFSGEELLAEESKALRVISRLTREGHALVLGNSCDNYSGDTSIWLAPIRDFKFLPNEASRLRGAFVGVVNEFLPKCSQGACTKPATREGATGLACDACVVDEPNDLPQAKTVREAMALTEDKRGRMEASDKWSQISRSATMANPKKFYMPGDPSRNFNRSEAHIALAQPFDPKYLTKSFKDLEAKRLFGLNDEAVGHLQYTIGSVFSRNPRNDHAWPSDDDLALKLTWLEEQLAHPALKEDERKKIESEIGVIAARLARAK